MRQRAPVWAARAYFLTPVIAALWFFFRMPIAHSGYWFPYGHLHYVWEGIFAVISYGIATLFAITFVSCILVEIGYATKILWAIAWNRPYFPWKYRTKTSQEGRHINMKRREKPQPLIRGRMGSR